VEIAAADDEVEDAAQRHQYALHRPRGEALRLRFGHWLSEFVGADQLQSAAAESG
jgi:hypothetical protein